MKENERTNRQVHIVTAWGETKTLRGWFQDARCKVSYSTLYNRIVKKEMAPEDAICMPQKPRGVKAGDIYCGENGDRSNELIIVSMGNSISMMPVDGVFEMGYREFSKKNKSGELRKKDATQSRGIYDAIENPEEKEQQPQESPEEKEEERGSSGEGESEGTKTSEP